MHRAWALCGERRFDEALEVLRHTVGRSPGAFDAWLLLAQLEIRQERYDVAERAAANAIALRPGSPDALYTLGRVHKARGELESAVACYRRALDANPANADVLTSLGVALRGLGRLDDAIATYRRALALHPHHTEAHNNLGNAIAAQGAVEEARAHHERARSRLTEELNAILERSMLLEREGRMNDAFECCRDALRLAPNDAGIWLRAGRLAQQMGFDYMSLAYYEKAVGFDPASVAAVDSARRICVAKGLHERAVRYSRQAYELQPSDITRIAEKLLIPSIQPSTEAIDETRRRYACNLDEILASDMRIEGPDGLVGMTAFYLAYHGKNDRDLQVKAAQMFLKVMPSLTMTAAHCLMGPRRPGRVRVGLISRFLHDHSIGKTTRGLVERLSREHFEVYVLRISPTREDETARAIAAAADHALLLDENFFRAREQIAALELDILFYQDIGMEASSYFLAFARLAPVQCVSFGHPNTTGIPSMDYFISNDLFETPEAQAHYSERLFLLHDLPTLAYYYRPTRRAQPLDRASFGLPQEGAIYLCPQTLYKLHPDFDELLRGILLRDPGGLVVLIAGLFDEFTEKLRERFACTMPQVTHRVKFIAPLRHEEFLELLALADVVLDTMHFNGMNSSLESFAVGTPVVTLPTALQRGRHTQAMYRKMGIYDCIAGGAQEYIDIAVRLGTDRTHARTLRHRILQRNAVLFEDKRVVSEFERCFLSLHDRRDAASAAAPAAPVAAH